MLESESHTVEPSAEQAEFRSPEQWFDQYSASMQRYAMSILRRWSDAEEVTQEAFFRLVKSGNENVNKAMLFTIVRNLSLDHIRRNKRRRFEPIPVGEIPGKIETRDDQLVKLESGVELAMEQLPENWAEALRLKINGGLSYDDISKVLDATHAQVRTWIYRARKQLAKELSAQGLIGGVN